MVAPNWSQRTSENFTAIQGRIELTSKQMFALKPSGLTFAHELAFIWKCYIKAIKQLNKIIQHLQ